MRGCPIVKVKGTKGTTGTERTGTGPFGPCRPFGPLLVPGHSEAASFQPPAGVVTLEQSVEGDDGRTVPAARRNDKIVLLLLHGEESQTGGLGHRNQGDAPFSSSLGHRSHNGVVRSRLGPVARR